MVQRECRTLTPLPASADQEQDYIQHIHWHESPRHCANSAQVSSHVPALPQQEVYAQASHTIPFPVLGFSRLKPLHMLFGVHFPYYVTSITWHLADCPTASWHALHPALVLSQTSHHTAPRQVSWECKSNHSLSCLIFFNGSLEFWG